MDDLYGFVFRGLLARSATHTSIREASQGPSNNLSGLDLESLLAFDVLDANLVEAVSEMAQCFIAITAFELSVRRLISSTLEDEFGDDWWDSFVPAKIRKSVENQLKSERATRWHAASREMPIDRTSLLDLSKIIAKNEDVFNDVFNISWAKQLLESLNQSRRITMHGGMLDEDDIVRIGVWIRDWNRQVGI